MEKTLNKGLNEKGNELNNFMSQLADGKKFIRKTEPVLLRLKERAEGLSTPDLKKERVKTSPPRHAMFTSDAEYVADMEAQLSEIPEVLEKLEKQVYDVIKQEPDALKRYILASKFIDGISYGEIGENLAMEGKRSVNRGTIHRWAFEALNNDLEMPEDPIWLDIS